jgi:chromosome segregation ATPase
MDKEMLEILKRLESKIDQGLSGLDTKMDNLETKLDEHTLILRALEHSAQVNKAEHDKMSNDIAKIQGDVAGIRKDLSQVELVTANNWADIVKLKAVK